MFINHPITWITLFGLVAMAYSPAISKSGTLLNSTACTRSHPSLSPRTKRNIQRIVPFGFIWFIFSQIFLISDYAAVGSFADIPGSAITLNLSIYIFSALMVSSIGLLVGAIEMLYLNNRFSRHSLAQKLAYKSLFYVVLMFSLIVVCYLIAASMELQTSLFSEQVWAKLSAFLISKTFLGTVVQIGTMLGISLIYAEISEHMGHGVLRNFLTGAYHSPHEEERIFMFSDMKSSTAIAEKLGHERYFQLLKSYYADISESIVMHGGEIYQYVGDEVIVSWPAARGLDKQNCIRCFYAMKRALREKAAWYQQNFGLVPDFKAGFHMGTVTTGEIGALKKEIIYTGDVLNATARIQGLCNQYGVDLLLSKALLNQLKLVPYFISQSLGHSELRGKARKVELFTLV